MHELPITQSVLDIALRYAAQEEATRITNLYLLIGELSSIVDDSVQFFWDIISRDTIAEGATLHFERVPMQMLCLACGEIYRPAPGTLACPKCESNQVKVAGGEEFRLESIDIERRDSAQDQST